MKESGKERLKSTIYESTLSTADAVPLPRWGRQISGGFAEIEGSGRSCSGIRYLTYDVFATQDDETGRCPKAGG